MSYRSELLSDSYDNITKFLESISKFLNFFYVDRLQESENALPH